MIPKLTIVYDPDVRDWEAFYVDGKQIEENHSIRLDDVLQHLHKLGVIEYEQKNGTPGLTNYSFPEKLEDVQYDPDWKEEY